MTDVHEPAVRPLDGHAHPHDEHPHEHEHDHEHNHDHEHHDHEHRGGLRGLIATIFHLHGHDHEHGSLAADAAVRDNNLAIRTVWLALAALGITTVLQIAIYLASGSVALLGDTVHNLGDALNSIPLLIAFYLARRPPNRRYTYGYSRAEDVAGLAIVVSIAFSAAYILWESVQKLLHPAAMDNPGWVALAAIVGFLGNEAVALLQIRVGRRIGSDAMVADGLHARIDGYTSLAVLVAAIGAVIGLPILDPIIGILIGLTVVWITRGAALSMWYRLMDAVDPKLMDQAEAILRGHPQVKRVERLQMRWLGHRLHAEGVVALDPSLPISETEAITDHIIHHLYHDIPTLAEATVAVVPYQDGERIFYRESGHHRPTPR